LLKAVIQEFIQLHVAVERGPLEGSHEVGRHAELERDKLGGRDRAALRPVNAALPGRCARRQAAGWREVIGCNGDGLSHFSPFLLISSFH
jgi:hypothetical protein